MVAIIFTKDIMIEPNKYRTLTYIKELETSSSFYFFLILYILYIEVFLLSLR